MSDSPVSQIQFFDIAPWREQMLAGGRTVCWFSCGVTSLIAAHLAIKKYKGIRPIHIVYTDTGSEHPDNWRFLADCEKWLGCKIEILKNPKYRDVDDVIEKERYINGRNGAKCTGVLKKAMRHQYQKAHSDIQVFGFDARPNEIARAAEFRAQNPEVVLETPLIDAGLTHADCLAILREIGIALPIMYLLGFKNNNCIGCTKGGAGYWNKVRIHFPETFQRRARQERWLGYAMCRIKGAPVFPDELPPDAGNYEAEPEVECGVLCGSIIQGESSEL